jgi:alpha-acetolactate decarboxylase
MKYVKSFESHRNSKNLELINEELLGGIINFFKNMWGKAMEELKKLGEDPDTDEVRGWISDNPFNPSDNNYLFKNVMDEFKKKPEANDQDALTLVDSILNPETGVLGKQGLAPLYESLKKAYPSQGGESSSSQYATFEYIFNTIRTKAIIQYKFAASTDGNVDPKKINIDLKDMTHLPDVKKILTTATDGKKKKDVIVNWCEKTLFPQLDKFADAITEEEINKYLESKNIPIPGSGPDGGYKVGDNVVYKREKFDQVKWDALTDDDKKKPNEGKMKELQTEEIGIKKISKIDGDTISFEGETFTKTKDDLLMKSDEIKAEGQEDLVKKLGDLKTKNPEDIKKVGSYVDFISDEANKDKVAQIDKIIGGGEETGV